jgi:hypothetical protein
VSTQYDLIRQVEGGSGSSYLRLWEFRPWENGGEPHREFSICEIVTCFGYWTMVKARGHIVEG